MQAQRTKPQSSVSVSITPKQSLECVKTLLSASFGCISYLRHLLPEDNFGEGRLTAANSGDMSFQSSQETLNSRTLSGVRIKTVIRGFSVEANSLLDYLEEGIFDAIEKQYLKSFIFAIYLDDHDPNNIVEAYTYNFSYPTVPGSEVSVPILTLGDDLAKLTLNGGKHPVDPVAEATRRGNVPTLGDVKKSVKALIKNMVMLVQSLDPLPKRRFATFKLFYRENTPEDYQPPHFRAGDSEKDKFVFTTHGTSEKPEKFSVGSVSSPYHGVDLHVSSVVSYLPSSENNDAGFAGLASTRGPVFPNMTYSNGVGFEKQIEAQRKDAEQRVFVWDAENAAFPRLSDEDAEGDPDPDFVNDSGVDFQVPIGQRDANGCIIPIMKQDAMDVAQEAQAEFRGKAEIPPSRVGKMRSPVPRASIDPTQQLESTQLTARFTSGDRFGGAASADPAEYMEASEISNGIDTQVLQDELMKISPTQLGSEMPNTETQAITQTIPDSIESFSARDSVQTQENVLSSIESISTITPLRRQMTKSDSINCICELSADSDVVLCEGSCQRWLHIWCMGYHSEKDGRLPIKFVCTECRLRGDLGFSLIAGYFDEILTNFSETATFRQAIKLVEQSHPDNVKAFKKLAICTPSLAEQLWKRMEREGFLIEEITEQDSVGLLVTRSRANPQTTKKGKRKGGQAAKYVFNNSMKETPGYQKYFSPGSEEEMELLGLKRGKKRAGKTSSKRKDTKEAPMVVLSGRVENTGNTDAKVDPTQHSEESTVNGLTTEASAATRNLGQGQGNAGDRGLEQAIQIESQTQEDTQAFDEGTLPIASEGSEGLFDGKRAGSTASRDVRSKKRMKISVGDGIDIEEIL